MFLINKLNNIDYDQLFEFSPDAYDLVCSVIAHLMFENAKQKGGNEQKLIDLAEKVNEAYNKLYS